MTTDDDGRRRTTDDEEEQVPEYWFNVETKQVEEGRQSDWSVLMGPYPTREEAERALETARARTEQWDEEERQWEEWGEQGPRNPE